MDLPKLISSIKENGVAQVLIVGARGDNFPPPYHQHPQVVIWDTAHTSKLPERVRLIIPLRFLSHAVWRKLIDEARKRNVVMLGLKGTGEVKRLLDPLLQAQPTAPLPIHAEEAPILDVPILKEMEVVAQEALATIQNNNNFAQQPKETLRAWLDRHVNWAALSLDAGKGVKIGEAKRLLDLAHNDGYVSATIGGIDVELGRMKRIRHGQAPAPVAPKQTSKKVAKAKPQPQTRIVPANMSEDDRLLLQMVAEAKAALDLVADALKAKSQKRQELITQLRGL